MITAATIDGASVLDTPSGIRLTNDTVSDLLKSSPPRAAAEDRTDADGVIELTRRYDAKTFTLHGRVGGQGTTWQDFDALVDQLERLFALEGRHTLVTTRASGQQRQVAFTAISAVTLDAIGLIPSAKWSVDVRAADPRWYGTALKSATFDPSGTPPAGLSLPLVFPLDLSGPGFNVVTLVNAGNASTPPTYTFVGPWSNPWIRNDTTGVSLYSRGVVLAAGEELVVDVSAEQVTLIGERYDAAVDWSRSDWPWLVRGSNTFTAGGDFAAGASLTVEAVDAWL